MVLSFVLGIFWTGDWLIFITSSPREYPFIGASLDTPPVRKFIDDIRNYDFFADDPAENQKA